SLLLKGARGVSAKELAERFGALGFVVEARSGVETLRVDGAGLSRNADAFFAELAKALSAPAYADDEVALWQRKALQQLKNLRADPEFLAGERLKRELYPGHPYGKAYPDEAAIQAVTGDALRAFHSARVVPDGSTLVVVGDVDPVQLKARL